MGQTGGGGAGVSAFGGGGGMGMLAQLLAMFSKGQGGAAVDPYENPQGPTWQPSAAGDTASFYGAPTATADTGGNGSWGRALGAAGRDMMRGNGALASPFSTTDSQAWPTLASPIRFQTVIEFLQALQGGAGGSKGRKA